MATQKSPLSGYNHNLKYKGRVYHVQTEDSGLDNPHIFTHLFHDGTILRTSKQEYRDLLADPEWETQLRSRMQGQHKDMMKELLKGSCDDRIVAFFGVLESAVEEELHMSTLPPPPKRERAMSEEAQAQAATQALAQAQAARSARAPAPAQPAAPAQPVAPAMQAPAATPWNPPPPLAPAAPQQRAQPRQSSGVIVSMPMVIGGGAGAPAPRPTSPSAAMSAAPSAPAPQATFRPEESKPVPDSIFGSDLISEKSLDEVILAYLSEDLAEK